VMFDSHALFEHGDDGHHEGGGDHGHKKKKEHHHHETKTEVICESDQSKH